MKRGLEIPFFHTIVKTGLTWAWFSLTIKDQPVFIQTIFSVKKDLFLLFGNSFTDNTRNMITVFADLAGCVFIIAGCVGKYFRQFYTQAFSAADANDKIR